MSMLRIEPHDKDSTSLDLSHAVTSRQFVREDSPWCSCKRVADTLISCRICGRLLGPIEFRYKNLATAVGG